MDAKASHFMSDPKEVLVQVVSRTAKKSSWRKLQKLSKRITVDGMGAVSFIMLRTAWVLSLMVAGPKQREESTSVPPKDRSDSCCLVYHLCHGF
mmetsp:Transcript_27121/g.39717  ORF Transcript_27121/g.39717 Transcript_27121/m.39717 type:complete len:94 (-) Transcript_27121:408-689(-)